MDVVLISSGVCTSEHPSHMDSNLILNYIFQKQHSPQIIMSSATLDPHIIEFVSSKVKNLEVVSSGIVSPATIKHNCVVVPADRKTEAVLKVLESNRADDGSLLKTIIFVLKKELCNSLNEV